MKSLTLLIIAGNILFAFPVLSQDIKIDTIKSQSTANDQFKEDLKESVDDFESAKNINELVSAANRLSLIANKFKDQWSANYYACYSLTVLSYVEKEAKKKDAYLDEAEVYLSKAFSEFNSASFLCTE